MATLKNLVFGFRVGRTIEQRKAPINQNHDRKPIISSAFRTGRRNTIQCVDSTMLLREK